MRRVAIIAVCLWLLGQGYADAQSSPACGGPVYPISGAAEAITVSSTALGFTTANIANNGNPAVRAECSIATDNIRYRDDGLDPSATVGVLILSSKGNFTVCGAQVIKQARMIRQTNDAALFCTYYSAVP